MIAPRLRSLVRVKRSVCPFKPRLKAQYKYFSVHRPCLTDGVFGELTAMRTRMPFIEAFKRQVEKDNGAIVAQSGHSKPEVKNELSPKTMSDSYHRVVSLLESNEACPNG